MPDKEQPRSIRFPQSLWNAIDRDAVRCKRSAVKQMEAVLAEYYRLANVELSDTAMEQARRNAHLPDSTKTQAIKATATNALVDEPARKRKAR